MAKIHFHDLQIPTFLSLPPDPDASIQFPAHLQASFDAALQFRKPVAEIIQKLSTTAKGVVV